MTPNEEVVFDYSKGLPSIVDYLKGRAHFFDLRSDQGKRYELPKIMTLVMSGHLMGISSIRGIWRFFNPLGSLEDSLKGKYPSVNIEALEGGKLSKEVAEKWMLDLKEEWDKAAAETVQRQNLFNEMTGFTGGIPHYSTISRAMQSINTDMLVALFNEYMINALPDEGARDLLLDGKALRGAKSKEKEGKNLYMMNVMDATGRLVITSFPVGDKKSELSTLKAELDNLLLGTGGYLLTADAMATHKPIMEAIVELGSDYLFPVKKNQRNLMNLLRGSMVSLCPSIGEEAPKAFSCFADVNFQEQATPSGIIVPYKVSIREEDYANPVEGYVEMGEDGDITVPEGMEKPLQESDFTLSEITDGTLDLRFAFFDNLYDYKGVPGIPLLSEADTKDKSCILVQLGERYIKMSRNGDRYERREIECYNSREWLDKNGVDGFDSVQTVGMITRYRLYETYVGKKQGKQWVLSITRTPYITSKRGMRASALGGRVRTHWAIEELHHDLDQQMGEDACTSRVKSAPFTLSICRKWARNVHMMVAHFWQNSQSWDGKTPDLSGLFHAARQCTRHSLEKALKYLTRSWEEIRNLL